MPQAPGMWFAVELPQAASVTELQFESAMPGTGAAAGGRAAAPTPSRRRRSSGTRAATRWKCPMDGKTWSKPVAVGKGERTAHDDRVRADAGEIRAHHANRHDGRRAGVVDPQPAASTRHRHRRGEAIKHVLVLAILESLRSGHCQKPSSLIARTSAAAAFQAKPNSVWGGVPFGIFAPYRFGPEASDLDGALKALVNFGVSQTELSNAVVERYLGAPQPAGRGGGGGGAARRRPSSRPQHARRPSS